MFSRAFVIYIQYKKRIVIKSIESKIMSLFQMIMIPEYNMLGIVGTIIPLYMPLLNGGIRYVNMSLHRTSGSNYYFLSWFRYLKESELFNWFWRAWKWRKPRSIINTLPSLLKDYLEGSYWRRRRTNTLPYQILLRKKGHVIYVTNQGEVSRPISGFCWDF